MNPNLLDLRSLAQAFHQNLLVAFAHNLVPHLQRQGLEKLALREAAGKAELLHLEGSAVWAPVQLIAGLTAHFSGLRKILASSSSTSFYFAPRVAPQTSVPPAITTCSFDRKRTWQICAICSSARASLLSRFWRKP